MTDTNLELTVNGNGSYVNGSFVNGDDRHERYDDGDETMLMYAKHEKVPMKDFGSEVRASLDIAHFLQSAIIMLDVQETTVDGILDQLLNKVLLEAEPACSIEEAKSILFTTDAAGVGEKDGLAPAHLLARTIQCTSVTDTGTFDYDHSWICAIGNLPSLIKRHVAMARFKIPLNMGKTSKQVRLFILVLCPSKEKGTKNALETGRTFATIFADLQFRQILLGAATQEDFKRLIIQRSAELTSDQHTRLMLSHAEPEAQTVNNPRWRFAGGLRDDLRRRIPYYFSDYKDGLIGDKTLQKVLSTTLFLYFASILPAIAFGVLNDQNTKGRIDVKRVIIGQVIGGLFWGVFSGQPLLVQLTTAPLAIYIKVIYHICEDFDLDFNAMYCAVGLFNSLFLVFYSLFDVSKLMRWSTRSTEEIFALFISVAFCNDAMWDVVKNFKKNYYNAACELEKTASTNASQLLHVIAKNASVLVVPPVSPTSVYNHTASLANETASLLTNHSLELATNGTLLAANQSSSVLDVITSVCKRENSVLYLLLMCGTLWLSLMLYNFNKTPYLNANKREILADYALPVAVIVLSFLGSFVFSDIKLESKMAHFRYDDSYDVFVPANLGSLTIYAWLASAGMGFCLSMLFFMDQNIGSAMVNNPCNKLKKGPAYHLDMLVVALMNGFLSVFGLPWMHACLPHSPLHVRSLADVEERVDQGHVYEIIVKVRETRLTGLFSNILIGLSLFLLPYPLAYIPTAVLDGLFLYMAVTALNGNQFFERFTLFFMEQAAYPPNHYIRRVPQKSIHVFTCLQFVQLLIMCGFGFSSYPYMKMVFPVLLLLLLPIRHKIVPKFIEPKYLAALDGQHQ